MKAQELNLKNLENNLIDKLNALKVIMDEQNQNLAVSIRRDVVATELKVILQENDDTTLRDAINSYIKDLYDAIIIEKAEEENGSKEK